MPLLFRPADHQVNVGGVDATVAEDIRKAHDVPADAVECSGEQMPQIVGGHLGRLHPRRLAQPLEFVPDLPTRNALPDACEKNLTGSDFLFLGVLHQLAAQLGGE